MDGGFKRFIIPAERPLLACEGDFAVGGDEKQPHRQADIFFVDVVVDPVDDHRQFQVEADLTGGGDFGSLLVRLRLVVVYVFDQVVRDAPAVMRVRLADVDQQELNAVGYRRVLNKTGAA